MICIVDLWIPDRMKQISVIICWTKIMAYAFTLLQFVKSALLYFRMRLPILGSAFLSRLKMKQIEIIQFAVAWIKKCLSRILSSMDTEYDCDWMALKAVILAIHSRAETYKLGIKPDRAVTFLLKVLFASEESRRSYKKQQTFFNVGHAIDLRKWKPKLKVWIKKIEKQEHLLSEKRSIHLQGEKNALKERLDNLKTLKMNDDKTVDKRVKQATKRIVKQLLNSHRHK